MPSSSTRLKREECLRTKHDSLFSPWKLLIGSFDWEDHFAGKEGVQRYRLHNLPEHFPGLYELGVTRIPTHGLRTRKHDLSDTVVVYLGKADNVRARLQQYGRTGSHLDYGNSFSFASKAWNDSLVARPGLFREIFSKGYSLVFRCAPMGNKLEAAKAEAQLLRVFDYAWNKLQNGACRHEEILLNLEQEVGSYRSSLRRRIKHFKLRIFNEQAGIKINMNGSVDTSSSIMKNIFPQVRRFVGHRPQLVYSGDSDDEHNNIYKNYPNGYNSWRDRLADGRKRGEGRKVKKIDVPRPRTRPKQFTNTVCAALLEDGSFCLEHPVQERKRCELHKGRRAKGNPKTFSCGYPSYQIESLNELAAKANDSNEGCHTAGIRSDDMPFSVQGPFNQVNSFDAKAVTTGEGAMTNITIETPEYTNNRGAEMTAVSICEPKGTLGKESFELHSGWKATKFDLADLKGLVRSEDGVHSNQLSGETTFDDGSLCQEKKLAGRMWFKLIKAQKPASTLSSACPELQTRATDDSTIICGVVTNDGSCRKIPIAGRKRCEEHKGMRIISASSVPVVRTSGWPSVCGAASSDGSPCMNQPIGGRKRCALHKGQKALHKHASSTCIL